MIQLRDPFCTAKALLALFFLIGAFSKVCAIDYYVNPTTGNDGNAGTMGSPWQTVSKILDVLPEVVTTQYRVFLAPGTYTSTGAHGTPSNVLSLDRRMRREGGTIDVSCYFIGTGPSFVGDAAPGEVVLDFGSTPLVLINGGTWYFQYVQVGDRSYGNSQQGFEVYGTDSLVRLRDVRIRTGSLSGSGIIASRGAAVQLYGTIEINEDLHEIELASSFAAITASYNGSVKYRDPGGSLSIGNGTLSALYYGTIELGCDTARITSWNRQSNCLAINDSGRIDLHGTTTTLKAQHVDNTLIGLEDDGHILAEGADIILKTISGAPGRVIMQKASDFMGGTLQVDGPRGALFSTSSDSAIVCAVSGVVETVVADTSGYCYLLANQAPGSTTEMRNGKIDIQISASLKSEPLVIESLSKSHDGNVSLSWNDVSLSYTVEYNTNVQDGAWGAVGGVWPSMENSWSNTASPGASRMFYRVKEN